MNEYAYDSMNHTRIESFIRSVLVQYVEMLINSCLDMQNLAVTVYFHAGALLVLQGGCTSLNLSGSVLTLV